MIVPLNPLFFHVHLPFAIQRLFVVRITILLTASYNITLKKCWLIYVVAQTLFLVNMFFDVEAYFCCADF